MVKPNHSRHLDHGSEHGAHPPRRSLRSEPPNGARSKPDEKPAEKPADRPIGPDLAAMWQAGKAAITHGRILAQVGWFQKKANVRTAVANLLFAIVLAIALVAAIVTMAVWSTNHLLAELSVALGGGLVGCVSAIAIVLGTATGLFLFWHHRKTKKRLQLLAAKVTPQPGAQAEPDAELTEIDRIRLQAIANLQADRDKLSEHAGAILQKHPIATLGASAATGLVVTRLLMMMPRTLRRGAIGALRLGTSSGIASLFWPAPAAEVPASTNSESRDPESA